MLGVMLSFNSPHFSETAIDIDNGFCSHVHEILDLDSVIVGLFAVSE
jgi:hypothetical protein